MDPGFIPSINNSVGIGVGLDWLNGQDHCNPGGCYGYDRLVLPVVVQWNFWFTPHWSAFGEPGLAFRFNDNNAYYNNHDLTPRFRALRRRSLQFQRPGCVDAPPWDPEFIGWRELFPIGNPFQ